MNLQAVSGKAGGTGDGTAATWHAPRWARPRVMVSGRLHTPTALDWALADIAAAEAAAEKDFWRRQAQRAGEWKW